MKITFIVLFTVMVLIAPMSAIADKASPDTQQDLKFKVMSYNIAAGSGGDGTYDIDHVAETIENSGADVIGLQEVDVHWGARSNFDNQVEYLAEKLDMHAFFAPIYSFEPLNDGDPRREYGLAVLSKYPITESENHDISRLSTQDTDPVPALAPGFPGVVINVKGVHVPFYNTHLDYRGDPFVREMQVDDTLNIISDQKNAILVGDLNARPDAPELTPLFNRFEDAWTIAGEGDGYTFPRTSPDRRIDYILSSPGMNISNTEIIESDASDHLPLTTEVVVTRRR